MLARLSGNHRKDIAFLMYVIMGLEMVLPLPGYARGGRDYPAPIPARVKAEAVSKPSFTDMLPLPQHAVTQKEVIKKGDILGGVAGIDEKVGDIDGPSQPETRQFTPVGTSDMVDLFTGDFSYNIPLLDVGGYPVNISYSGNVGMDQEASWVGLGWNINPGAITRSMRGLPDDFNGTDKIIKTNRMKPHTIVGGSIGAGFEFVGLPLNLNMSLGAFYNSKTGWGTEFGINPSVNLGKQSYGTMNGGANVGLGLNFNSQEGIGISPSFSYSLSDNEKKELGSGSVSTNYNSRQGLTSLTISSSAPTKGGEKGQLFSGGMSFARTAVSPSISMPFTSSNYSFSIAPGGEAFVGHVKVNLNGYYTRNEIKGKDQTQRKPAYGYLYYSAANGNDGALLDFNRDKETPYRDKPMVQNIAIPSYTYDAFSATGEGSSGMFRAYRGDVGHTFDHYMRSKSQSFTGGLDVGIGAGAKWGGNFSYAQTNTTNSSWDDNNGAQGRLGFTAKSGWHEPVYFRNAGEALVSRPGLSSQVGGDKLLMLNVDKSFGGLYPSFNLNARFDTYGGQARKTGELAIPSNISSGEARERRNQVVSYLTADEALQAGNEYIVSYGINYFHTNCTPDINRVDYIQRRNDIRKGNHISKMDVLNADGRRYEYGIAAYNTDNREVSYSLRRRPEINRQASLVYSRATHTDADQNNGEILGYELPDDAHDKATDEYFTRQITPPFSHSFLLTGVYSPDYMDVTGDGPTEDDLGDGVNLKYSRVYSPDNPYRWRTPMHPVNKSYTPERDVETTYTDE